MTPRASNPAATFALVLAVFAATAFAPRLVPASIAAAHPWSKQACQQGLMVLAALGAMIASGRPLAAFGFRRAVRIERTLASCGLLLGVVSSCAMLTFKLRGLNLAAYSFPMQVLWVWIVSSVVEEIFCRGWFQSLAAGLDAGDPRAARAAVIWSTALFGSLHFVLLAGGIDLGTFAVILVSVTTLGYVCALARARSGSLVPAITAHVAFNVGGGFVGGLLYAIVYRIATGRLPFAR